MIFLILSKDYTGTIVCERLKKEGHTYYYVNPTHRNNGISTIANIHLALVSHIDCCIICSTGFNVEQNIIVKKGIPCFGGTEFQDKIELDSLVLERLCKQYNIRLLKKTTNTSYALSTEIWFSNGEPLYQYFNYMKQAKFLAGDLGVDIPEGETVVFWANANRNVEAVKRIFENGLFEALKTIKYSGIFALDSYISIDDNYPYIFKVYARLQAPVLTAMLELYKNNFGNLLYSISTNDNQSILLEDSIALSVSISQPPYPYDYSGLVKYLVTSNIDWFVARKQMAKKIKELDISNIQYRIDGGMQGAELEQLKKLNYFSN